MMSHRLAAQHDMFETPVETEDWREGCALGYKALWNSCRTNINTPAFQVLQQRGMLCVMCGLPVCCWHDLAGEVICFVIVHVHEWAEETGEDYTNMPNHLCRNAAHHRFQPAPGRFAN